MKKLDDDVKTNLRLYRIGILLLFKYSESVFLVQQLWYCLKKKKKKHKSL